MTEPTPSCWVRDAQDQDIAPMIDLLAQLFGLERDFAIDAAKQRRGLELLLAHRPPAKVLVAERNGAVVGMATAQLVISTAMGTSAAWVEDLIVADFARHHGIGSALLNAMESWARAHGITRLQLLADTTNAPAHGFYRHHGWAPTHLIAWRKTLTD